MHEPRAGGRGWVVAWLLGILLALPLVFLSLLSLGSGWTFPHVLPDRIDLAPWRYFLAGRAGFLLALGTSASASLLVGTSATAAGLLGSRFVRRAGAAGFWRFVIYMPFILSPVVIGVCLYDLWIRLGLAGRFIGVVLAEFLFAFAFATVLLTEVWDPRIDEYEHLVTTLGGGRAAAWRHGVLPQASGVILVCWIQASLFSWLDYGLASLLGGGGVRTLTVQLFSFIHEANVNQAAQASLLLLLPGLVGFGVAIVALLGSSRRSA